MWIRAGMMLAVSIRLWFRGTSLDLISSCNEGRSKIGGGTGIGGGGSLIRRMERGN